MLIALAPGEQFGYALIDDVHALTAGSVRLGPGTLYRSLQRMRVAGWIEEVESASADSGRQLTAAGTEPTNTDRRSERRRSYRLTPAGRAAAATEVARLSHVIAAAAAVGLDAAPQEDRP